MFGRKNFLASIKRRLQDRRRELLARLEEIAKKTTGRGNGYEAKFPQYGRTEDENADEVSAFTDILCQKDEIENSLKEVDLALAKIRQGKYGICEKCEKKIDEKRLEALPTAKYCLSCKQQLGK